MNNANSVFASFKSAKPTSLILGVGKHVVRLIRILMIDSFTNLNGSAKEDSIWSEPTPQLAVQVGSDKGTITTRLNGLGYLHTDQVDQEYMEKNGFVDVEGYVATPLENGKFERVISDANCEACANILNRFFHACAVPEGTSLEELMVLAKDNDIKLQVEVVANEYDDKSRNEIKYFSQVTAEVEAAVPDLA